MNEDEGSFLLLHFTLIHVGTLTKPFTDLDHHDNLYDFDKILIMEKNIISSMLGV